jgi:hypothetical protein
MRRINEKSSNVRIPGRVNETVPVKARDNEHTFTNVVQIRLRLVLVFAAVFAAMCPHLFADTVYFPQVADGGGYVTTFTLINSNSSLVTGTLRLFNPDGSPRTLQLNGVAASEFPISLSAGATVRLSSSGSGPRVTVGWASLESTPRLQGGTTFDYRSNGLLQTTAGVFATTGVSRVFVPIDWTRLLINTGLAIVNVEPSTAISVRATLYDESGTAVNVVGDPRLTPIDSHKQVALFITQLLPTAFLPPNSFKGSVALEVIGSGSIAVTALTINEGLLSGVPVIDASGTLSSDKSFEQVQTERLIGTWMFTSGFSVPYFLPIDLHPSTTSPGEWFIWGWDALGETVFAGYSNSFGKFYLFDINDSETDFFVFDFTGSDTVSGCHHQLPIGTNQIPTGPNWGVCSPTTMTGVRRSPTVDE